MSQGYLVQVGKEAILQKFREWARLLKKRAQIMAILPEDSGDGLITLLQALNLEAEQLPELFEELKQTEEKVAEGSFYSPPDEIEFLVRQCLFHQISLKLPLIPKQYLQELCFFEEKLASNQLSKENVDRIVQCIASELKVVDPSCGVGNFLIQYLRVVISWISLLRPDEDLGDSLRSSLIGGISGVDSDPVAVVITRVRLAGLFTTLLEFKATKKTVQSLNDLLNISVVWGNALGIESTDSEKSKTNSTSPLFSWDANFAHILAYGGFNIVIGNPPYIRQEDIATPQKRQDRPWRSRKIDQKGRRKNRQYKVDLLSRLSTLARLDADVLSSKADLSAYFFLLAKYLCGNGGICGFITPNAWLDVQYGFELQDFLANHTTLLGVYERKFSRAFSAAAINTIITLFEPNPSNGTDKSSLPVEWVSVGTDYKDYMQGKIKGGTNPQEPLKFRGVAIQSELLPNNGSRRQIAPQELYSLGRIDKSEAYQGFKWGSLFLRAPAYFFKLHNLIASKLVSFLDIIDLNFGIKTGKNAFFIVPNKNVRLTREKRSNFLETLEMGKVSVPINLLKPIIVSSRGLSSYFLDERANKKYLVHISSDLPAQLSPYIKWGEQQRFHLAPSCQAHHPHWFNLPEQRSPDFIFFRFMDQRMWVPVNKGQLLFSDNFFVGYAKDPSYVKPYAAYFNSTIHLFFSEIWGRTSLGEGLLTFYGPDYKFLEILDPRALDHSTINELDRLFQDLANQPVQSILEDLQNPARISLDNFIMETIFNLPKSSTPQLYEAFQALVTQRLGRAKRKY